jgi:hypothetical protein
MGVDGVGMTWGTGVGSPLTAGIGTGVVGGRKGRLEVGTLGNVRGVS